MMSTPSVLTNGASNWIGAFYADRFARRGHDLVLVARDRARMEARLREDIRVGIPVNKAGASAPGDFLNQSPDDLGKIISLNTTALTRLASAVGSRLVKAGEDAVINISSGFGLAPEFRRIVYGGTKAFVLFLTQDLHLELAPKGVYVQAVLPAVTWTEMWKRAGKDVNKLLAVMEVAELVDAALVGFDRRKTVIVLSLPKWERIRSCAAGHGPEFQPGPCRGPLSQRDVTSDRWWLRGRTPGSNPQLVARGAGQPVSDGPSRRLGPISSELRRTGWSANVED
jgi:hypothetical protein